MSVLLFFVVLRNEPLILKDILFYDYLIFRFGVTGLCFLWFPSNYKYK